MASLNVPRKNKKFKSNKYQWIMQASAGIACLVIAEATGRESVAQVRNIYGNEETAKCYSYSNSYMIQMCLDQYEKHLRHCVELMEKRVDPLPSYCRY